MQRNLELEKKKAEKTDIDGKKDEKRKSHIKKDIKTDSIGTSLHKVLNGAYFITAFFVKICTSSMLEKNMEKILGFNVGDGYGSM